MTLDDIKSLGPELSRYVEGFRHYMGQSRIQPYFSIYVRGQLGPLERKSIEPMADAAGESPRTLQKFLGEHEWDEEGVKDCIQRKVARRSQGGPETIGQVDETTFAKRGDHTAGVQRQYCGSTGKIDNCVVTINLGYAEPDFHALLDSELYLPKSWHEDRPRCREAGIPDELVYRPYHDIALSQIRRAKENAVRFDWMTADERYGMAQAFLVGLETLGQPYVVEVPRDVAGWTVCPKVLSEPPKEPSPTGRPLTYPRLPPHAQKPKPVEVLFERDRRFRSQGGVPFRVQDTHKGPLVWDVKATSFYQHRDGLPSPALQLLVARNVQSAQIKYFLAYNPHGAPLETLVRVAFSRWAIERCFQDYKGEIGLDHFEVRHYRSLNRHLILSLVSGFFYEGQRERLRGKKSRGDGLADPRGDGEAVDHAGLAPQVARRLSATHGRAYPPHPTAQRKSPGESSPQAPSRATQHGVPPHPTPPL